MSVRPHPRADRPQVRIALGMGLGDRLHLLLRRRAVEAARGFFHLRGRHLLPLAAVILLE